MSNNKNAAEALTADERAALVAEAAPAVVRALEALWRGLAPEMRRCFSEGWQWTEDHQPVCPKHSVPLQFQGVDERHQKRYGHNVGDDGELLCRGYAGRDSPGWDGTAATHERR